MIAALWHLATTFCCTVYYASRIVVAWALGERYRPGGTFDEMPRRYGRNLLRLNGVVVRTSGFDRLNGLGPCIYVANHESWFDELACMALLPGSVRFAAKKEMKYLPFIGWGMSAGGQIWIDRARPTRAIAAYAEAARAIRGGISAVVFAEGTRTRTGRLLPFKKGPFVLAIAAQVPVVPVYAEGGFGALPKGAVRPRPVPMALHVGEPIPTVGLTYEDRDALLARCRAAIVAMGAREP